MSERNVRGVIRRGSVAVVAIATVLAAVTLASGAKKSAPISAAWAFSFPPTKVCVGGNGLTFRLRTLPHVKWITVAVFVKGRHVKTVKLSRRPQPVKLRGCLPARSSSVSSPVPATGEV